MKVYNKLVRDNIPDIMVEKGAKPVIRILNDEEYLIDGNVEELADIEEVLLAILEIKKINLKDFENLRVNKVNKRGAFNKKIFLESEE